MKMNTGAWIGVIGGIIGLLVGVGAVVATVGDEGIWIGLGMLLLFGGMFYLFYLLFFKPMINANRLQKTGLPGKATILEVKDTGVTINNNPQVNLVLEVKNNLGQKYNTECRVLVSRLNPQAYQRGMEVSVKIDPQNEKNVVLDFSGNVTAAAANSYKAANADVLKAELEQLQKDNDALLASGRPARV